MFYGEFVFVNVCCFRISVLTQKIDKLKPGKFYNVQIMVRKPKGRMLSYELLQVRTKSTC